jgi:hypothetical protein
MESWGKYTQRGAQWQTSGTLFGTGAVRPAVWPPCRAVLQKPLRRRPREPISRFARSGFRQRGAVSLCHRPNNAKIVNFLTPSEGEICLENEVGFLMKFRIFATRLCKSTQKYNNIIIQKLFRNG